MELYREAKSVFEAAGATSTREYLDLLKSMAARLRQRGHREEAAALYREMQAANAAVHNTAIQMQHGQDGAPTEVSSEWEADPTDPRTDDTSEGIVRTSLTRAPLGIPPAPVR